MIRNILLIDDDPEELDIFTEALHGIRPDINCLYSHGAEAAINLLRHNHPDMIFIDINMPKINGFECLLKIKQIPEAQSIDVFLYSNYIDETLCKEAIVKGAKDCIKKPISISLLRKMLERILKVAND
jgi:CheY-like chemotaxis protein